MSELSGILTAAPALVSGGKLLDGDALLAGLVGADSFGSTFAEVSEQPSALLAAVRLPLPIVLGASAVGASAVGDDDSGAISADDLVGTALAGLSVPDEPATARLAALAAWHRMVPLEIDAAAVARPVSVILPLPSSGPVRLAAPEAELMRGDDGVGLLDAASRVSLEADLDDASAGDVAVTGLALPGAVVPSVMVGLDREATPVLLRDVSGNDFRGDGDTEAAQAVVGLKRGVESVGLPASLAPLFDHVLDNGVATPLLGSAPLADETTNAERLVVGAPFMRRMAVSELEALGISALPPRRAAMAETLEPKAKPEANAAHMEKVAVPAGALQPVESGAAAPLLAADLPRASVSLRFLGEASAVVAAAVAAGVRAALAEVADGAAVGGTDGEFDAVLSAGVSVTPGLARAVDAGVAKDLGLRAEASFDPAKGALTTALGPVRIAVEGSGEALRVTLTAPEAAAAALDGGRASLAASLQAQGMRLETLVVRADPVLVTAGGDVSADASARDGRSGEAAAEGLDGRDGSARDGARQDGGRQEGGRQDAGRGALARVALARGAAMAARAVDDDFGQRAGRLSSDRFA